MVRFSCAGSIVRLKLSYESLTRLNFKSCCFHCFKLRPRYNETPLYRTTSFGPFRGRYIRVLLYECGGRLVVTIIQSTSAISNSLLARHAILAYFIFL